MKIAIAPMEDFDDVKLNATKVQEKIIEASYHDADIIFFPLKALCLSPKDGNMEEIKEMMAEIVNYPFEYGIDLGIGVYNDYNLDYQIITFDHQRLKDAYQNINFKKIDDEIEITYFDEIIKIKEKGLWSNKRDLNEEKIIYIEGE